MDVSFHALAAAQLDRVRRVGIDDFGHRLRIFINVSPDGTPLRCCLREAAVGESVALLSWRPLTEAPNTSYAEVGPIFIHADSCAGYPDNACYPEAFRARKQVLRSYAGDGDLLECFAAAGADADRAITELLTDTRAVVVHSRNPLAGCYMFAARRATAPTSALSSGPVASNASA